MGPFTASTEPLYPPPARTLRAVESRELAPLVPAPVQERLLALAERCALPAQTVCLEARLASGDERVDLAVCLMPGFAAPGGFPGGFDHADHAPAWRRCLDLLAAWGERRGVLAGVPFMCLAFDVVEAASTALPCVSVCIDPDFFARRMGFDRPQSRRSVEELVDACHRAAYGAPLAGLARSGLRHCLLSGVVAARHFSFMFARSPTPMKLDVRLQRSDLEGFLRHIRWQGPIESVVTRIRQLMSWDGTLQLNLALYPTFVPSIEVELLIESSEVSREERFGLLERLVSAGLCDSAKAQVLCQCTGAPLLVDDAGRQIGRNWYVKVHFRADGTCEAKAYLCLIPRLSRLPSGAGAAISNEGDRAHSPPAGP